MTLRQVTRLVPAKAGGTRQPHALTSRDDLPVREVCWRLTSRWREENYFRYAGPGSPCTPWPPGRGRLARPGRSRAGRGVRPGPVPPGALAPDLVRLDAEVKQITHVIRMAACNAETTLA